MSVNADAIIIEPQGTLEDARKRLSEVFERADWFPPSSNSVIRSEVIANIKQFPVLATEKFTSREVDYHYYYSRTGKGEYHPLTFFVLDDFDLEELETIFLMHPAAVPAKQGVVANLLWIACDYPILDGTLLWLLSKCTPEMMGTQDDSESPLSKHIKRKHLLGTKASSHVVRAFLAKSHAGAATVLANVLTLGYDDRELFHHITSQVQPPPENRRTFFFPTRKGAVSLDWKFRRMDADVLAPAFEIFHRFSCLVENENWTTEGWHQLFHLLVENKKLQSFQMRLPLKFLSEHPACLESLQFLFRNVDSTFLQAIEFEGSGDRYGSTYTSTVQAIFQATFDGLEANPNESHIFENFSLSNFHGVCPQLLAKLGRFTKTLKTRELRIASARLIDTLEENTGDTVALWRGLSSIESLQVCTEYESRNLVVQTPFLTNVHLGPNPEHKNSTGPILALLEHPTLKKMEIIGPGIVHIEPFSRSLKKNSSLECLHLGCLDFLNENHQAERDTPTDITPIVISLLDHPELKKARMEHSYSINEHPRLLQVSELSEVFKVNTKMEELKLDCVDLHHSDESEIFALLRLVEGENRNLQILEVGAITFRKDPSRGQTIHFGYQARLHYTLGLNRNGRGKLQQNYHTYTTRDMADLFVNAEVDTRREMTTQKALFVERLRWQLTRYGFTNTDAFQTLLADPGAWASKEDSLDTVSANFGVLQELVGLWCTSSSRTATMGKKRAPDATTYPAIHNNSKKNAKVEP